MENSKPKNLEILALVQDPETQANDLQAELQANPFKSLYLQTPEDLQAFKTQFKLDKIKLDQSLQTNALEALETQIKFHQNQLQLLQAQQQNNQPKTEFQKLQQAIQAQTKTKFHQTKIMTFQDQLKSLQTQQQNNQLKIQNLKTFKLKDKEIEAFEDLQAKFHQTKIMTFQDQLKSLQTQQQNNQLKIQNLKTFKPINTSQIETEIQRLQTQQQQNLEAKDRIIESRSRIIEAQTRTFQKLNKFQDDQTLKTLNQKLQAQNQLIESQDRIIESRSRIIEELEAFNQTLEVFSNSTQISEARDKTLKTLEALETQIFEAQTRSLQTQPKSKLKTFSPLEKQIIKNLDKQTLKTLNKTLQDFKTPYQPQINSQNFKINSSNSKPDRRRPPTLKNLKAQAEASQTLKPLVQDFQTLETKKISNPQNQKDLNQNLRFDFLEALELKNQKLKNLKPLEAQTKKNFN